MVLTLILDSFPITAALISFPRQPLKATHIEFFFLIKKSLGSKVQTELSSRCQHDWFLLKAFRVPSPFLDLSPHGLFQAIRHQGRVVISPLVSPASVIASDLPGNPRPSLHLSQPACPSCTLLSLQQSNSQAAVKERNGWERPQFPHGPQNWVFLYPVWAFMVFTSPLIPDCSWKTVPILPLHPCKCAQPSSKQ